MIYISTSKTCARCTFSPLFVLNTIHMRFSIILSYPLKHFSAEWLAPPQKVHCVWTRFAISLFLPELELLPRFKYSAFRDEIDKYFCQYIFLSSLLCLVSCYLCTISFTLVKVIQENLYELILRITVSHWNW